MSFWLSAEERPLLLGKSKSVLPAFLETASAGEIQGEGYVQACKEPRGTVLHITAALGPVEIARYTCGNAPCIEANDAAQNPSFHIKTNHWSPDDQRNLLFNTFSPVDGESEMAT